MNDDPKALVDNFLDGPEAQERRKSFDEGLERRRAFHEARRAQLVAEGFTAGAREGARQATDLVSGDPIFEAATEIASVVAVLRETAEQVRAAGQRVAESREAVVGQLPILLGWDEAAQLAGISVASLKSRVRHGVMPEAGWAQRTGGKKKAGQHGGNAGRIRFVRDRIVMWKGAK